MGFREYCGGFIVLGGLYALAGVVWSGVFGFSLSIGALIGLLVGGPIGIIFTHNRITFLRRSWTETGMDLSPEVEKALAIDIGLGPQSNFTRAGFVIAVDWGAGMGHRYFTLHGIPRDGQRIVNMDVRAYEFIQVHVWCLEVFMQ